MARNEVAYFSGQTRVNYGFQISMIIMLILGQNKPIWLILKNQKTKIQK